MRVSRGKNETNVRAADTALRDALDALIDSTDLSGASPESVRMRRAIDSMRSIAIVLAVRCDIYEAENDR